MFSQLAFRHSIVARLMHSEINPQTGSDWFVDALRGIPKFSAVLVWCAMITLPFASPVLCTAQPVPAVQQPSLDEQEVFFESKIRPLLIRHCVECHGAREQSGELRLDRQEYFRRGGGSGPLVTPDNPGASRLIRAIGYQDNELQMPPESKLPEEAIALLTEWVRSGAHWPDEAESPQSAGASMAASKATVEPLSPAELSPAEQIELRRQTHWSYQPIQAVEPPSLEQLVTNNSGVAAALDGRDGVAPIDRFVRARLAQERVSPNPIADRRTLIHRAYFALLGLPPTYDEVQAFVADDDPDAFERLVDRLLESPHYGERWARHWLDIARYGDTKGYLAGSMETRYPYAFTYRDYVIDAFNSDKPFDQFIIEQLAADQLQLTGADRRALAAMGFLTVGRRFMNSQHDIIDDQIDVVTRGFLGMSVSCARCHDHKYDPIPTADYYSLYGVFASSEEPAELPLLGEPNESPEYEAFLQAQAEKQKEVDQWLDERRLATEDELRSRIADYLVHFSKTLPQYREDNLQPQGKRGALRRAAVRRWQQFLSNPQESTGAVWSLWHQLAALPAGEFTDKALAIVEQAGADHDVQDDPSSMMVPSRLINALREAKPSSMPEAAQCFGDCFEAVYAQWLDARKADATTEHLSDPQDESLRQVMWAAGAPTTLDVAQMISHLDQGERDRYNQLLSGVNGVSVTHPGAPPRGMVMVDRPNPVEPVIFRRGEPGNRGDSVPRRFLQVLSHVDGGQPFVQGSGRLELARGIANPDNPLTARVIVNRVWQHQFGEGLVRTSSDFGTRGELPTHPELLDYLAAEFMADGWSIKRLQRRIMLSATWRQSSAVREDAYQVDPENRLLWHMPRRRMEFEPLRDRLLVAAGRLDSHIGGRSVMIHNDATRRALYAYIDREDLPGLLASFDLPSPDASQAKRTETTVPQQALFLMNSGFVIEQAKALASRTIDGNPSHDGAKRRIESLYRLALSRDPDESEVQASLAFVDPSSRSDSADAETLDRWVQLAQVLLLCNEFAFVD